MKRTLAAACALVVVGIAACSDSSDSAGGRTELNLEIGDLVPLSGVEEPFGATGQKATTLAVTQIRKAIKEVKSDHTVTISHKNYRSEPTLAQEEATKLARAGTSCFVGPWSTAAAIPVANEVAVKNKVVAISPAAGGDAFATLSVGGYVSRTIAPASLQGEALATLIASELGGAGKKEVSIGVLDNAYGTNLTKSFTAAWRELGGTVAARVLYAQNLPDYKKQARELVAPEPDAFVFFDFQENYLRIASDLIRTKKWDANRSFASDSLAVSDLGQSGAATAEGLRGVAPSYPRLGAEAKAFERLWRTGGRPLYRQPFDTQAFDATVLCYLSAVAAGSTDGAEMRHWVRNVSSPPGKKYGWQQLPEAIRALEAGEEVDYQGASGAIDIEPLDVTVAANPTTGFYDAYRFKDARLAIYGSVAVPPTERAFQRIPLRFVSPRVPGVGPQPNTPIGATGATGATGAKGAKSGKGAQDGPREKGTNGN